MIIGLTGKNAAGKGEVAAYLKQKGFYYYSLSDVLREELRERGDELTRKNLIRVGRELRETHGEGCLAERILKRAQEDKNYVIDSFRHPSEIGVFRQHPAYRLLLVVADAGVRFQRIRDRGRESDPTTLAEFESLEEEEATSNESSGQQLELSALEADATVANNGSKKDLGERMELIMYALNDTVTPIPEEGNICTFKYFAKTPNIEYDQHPLVAMTELFQWGFRGINFHLRDYRQYTWAELGTQVYIVQRDELDDLLSLNYKKIVLNR